MFSRPLERECIQRVDEDFVQVENGVFEMGIDRLRHVAVGKRSLDYSMSGDTAAQSSPPFLHSQLPVLDIIVGVEEEVCTTSPGAE
jgi:hypothetical protein